MRAARAVIVLTLAVPGAVLAGADPEPPEPEEPEESEPRLPPGPPALDALLGTTDEVSAVVYGHGEILEARIGDHEGEAVVSVRTAAGWSTHALGYDLYNGTHHSVEDLRLVDVVGDAEPELWLEISSHRDPCGCNDGPVFEDSAITICKVTQHGLSCSEPVHVYSYAHVLEEQTWSAALTVSRSGRATLRSTRGRGPRLRSFRLFR